MTFHDHVKKQLTIVPFIFHLTNPIILTTESNYAEIDGVEKFIKQLFFLKLKWSIKITL